MKDDVRGIKNPYRRVKPLPNKSPQGLDINPSYTDGKSPQGLEIFDNVEEEVSSNNEE